MATEVMGLELGSGYEVRNENEIWITADGKEIIYVGGEPLTLLVIFNPLTNWNDTMMVVEQMESNGWSWFMEKNGYSWAIEEGKGICYVAFKHPDLLPRPEPIEEETDTKRAICLAALKAVSGE